MPYFHNSPIPFWEMTVRHTRIFLIAATNWGDDQSICFSGESAVISPACGRWAGSGTTGDCVVVADICIQGSGPGASLQDRAYFFRRRWYPVNRNF